PVRAAGTGQAQVVATLSVHASHTCFISERCQANESREEDTTNSMNRLNKARPVRSPLRARRGRDGRGLRRTRHDAATQPIVGWITSAWSRSVERRTIGRHNGVTEDL